jgi:tRNA pseudouridine38-40 synthase
MNYKVTLAYDGTCYSGFQRQQNANTIQEEVEKALARIYGREVGVSGAGRTDSGVHARGQVISFHGDGRVPLASLPHALKGLLPRDIVAWRAEQAPEDFHARFSPSRKEYCYTVDTGDFPDVFTRRYAYHCPGPLDLEAMQAAAARFRGGRDFSAFQGATSDTRETFRVLEEAAVLVEGRYLKLVFRAEGFLYKMVRIMAGTLLEVGAGRLEPFDLEDILQSRCRDRAGPTAPPHGLCLMRVIYDNSCGFS